MSHVVVVDLIGARLDKALKVGADTVINSADEDVTQRLIELHGAAESMWPNKAGTDIYLDAAGAPAVINTALATAKQGARLGVVAVHKEPVTVDFVNVMSSEITITGSMGYPKEIFEVTRDIMAKWEKYAVIVSHTFPFDDVDEALRTAATPGAADKVGHLQLTVANRRRFSWRGISRPIPSIRSCWTGRTPSCARRLSRSTWRGRMSSSFR